MIIQSLNFCFKIQHQQQGKHEEEGEEEELTHYGQSLAEIEKFDDIEPDSDSDEDGRLGGELLRIVHIYSLYFVQNENCWQSPR